jgi:CubicO group peptidase (beta-lactamase class C family)
MEMLLNGGSFNGAQILGRKTVDLMTTNQIGDLRTWGSTTFGLGFEIVEVDQTFKMPGSEGSFAWGGIFNTIYWMDKDEDMSATLMLQIFPFEHNEIKEKFKVLVYQALTEK